MSKIKLIRFIICSLILAVGFISQANATQTSVSFSSSGFLYQFGHDTFTVRGDTGSVNLDTTFTTVNAVNSALFTQGSCPFPFNTCAGSQTFDAGFLLQLGGSSGPDLYVGQPATWTSSLFLSSNIFAVDGPPSLFVLQGIGSWDVMLQGYTLTGTSGTQVQAVFTPVPGSFPAATPEPASIMLFGTGLLGMALMLRKSLLA